MKIVVSDCDHDSLDVEEKVLARDGLSFELFQCRTEDDTVARCKGAVIILNQYAPMTRKVIAALKPELRQIVRYGVGVNNIDLAAATEFGVQVCNVPDYSIDEVSDQALTMMMALARKLVPMNAATHAGAWDYQQSIPVFRLSERTVGVIGLGRIGRRFAEKAHALGCTVIGYDPVFAPAADDFVAARSLDEVLRTADIVSVHCPLTDGTRHLIDAAALAKMKRTALLINVSRGGIVDEEALAAALGTGRIAAAALDVAEVEPLPAASPLRGLANCLLTPHMGWYSAEAGLELKRKVAEEAARMARGEPVRYPVNTVS
ncbi:Dehydrogenase [uncultured Alphaproteobacteria bacterium]|uniref:Dehydrogenase n=1 Tax=uncultured Alphaproteobacteria bacterium TaxID=91750 RepID=A0A212KHU7_9PROT|nr:Dehydrogenase [uncultured Alphaproteobacteria bacterium]